MTPRHRSFRRTRVPSNDAGSEVAGANPMKVCGQTLLLARALHDAGPDPVERKRRLLAGLCDLVEADCALSAVTRTDVSTGRQTVLSVLAIRVARIGGSGSARPLPRGGRYSRRSAAGGAAAGSRAESIDPDALEAQAMVRSPGDGFIAPCLDDFCWLDGLKLAGCIMLFRNADSRRFTAADRAVVDLVHSRCSWVYAHDRHFAAFVDAVSAEPLDAVWVSLLRELLAGCDINEIARRLRMTLVKTENAIAALLERIGLSSREELMVRWSEAAS